MSATGTERLTGAEAMELLYVLTADVAQRCGVRALAIKGSVLAEHGLRAPRVSADIDVLVHPADVERFAQGMEAAGWRRAPESRVPKFLEHHSVNLLNDHWPMGIDAHVYFPGFLADRNDVFEALWERRTTLACAGRDVPCTDLGGSAAIAALHHLRAPTLPANVAAFEALVDRAEQVFDDTAKAELARLAERTGSVRTLQPFLERLGVRATAQHPAEESGFEAWERATTTHAHLAWWPALRSQRLREWPGFVWHAVMLSDAELRAYHGDQTETTPLWRLRVRRWRRVVRRLPAVLRHEWDRRRGRSTPRPGGG